jgi:hypothetical protein
MLYPLDWLRHLGDRLPYSVIWVAAKGLFTRKNPRTLPQKIRKNPKKNPKNFFSKLKNPTIFGAEVPVITGNAVHVFFCYRVVFFCQNPENHENPKIIQKIQKTGKSEIIRKIPQKSQKS